MLLTLLLLRILLCAIFGVAGVAKLLDPKGTRDALTNFGVPAKFARATAILLPLFEIAIAAGLLLQTTAWWSGLAALLLLALFIVSIGINLQRGKTHDCHCFGQLYSRPLGWPTLIRNVAFALGAGLIVWQGPRGAGPGVLVLFQGLHPTPSLVAIGAVGFAMIVAGAIILFNRRPNGDRPKPAPSLPKGLPLDSIAPAFELETYSGGTKSLARLLSDGKPALLIFSNPNCGPCVALFQEVAEWQRLHEDQMTIAIITQGTIKENFVNVARNRLETVLLQREREVAESYEATLTPTAVVVRADGTIGSRLAAGADDIRSLLRDSVEPPRSDQEPQVAMA